MSLIHPLLTKGREFTIKFSPSRRDMQVELSRSSTQVCVCCKMGTMSSVDIDGAPLKLVPVPADICNAANTACPHYAHEKCLNLLKSEVNSGCPRCKEFMNLAHIDSKVSYKISHPIYSKHVSVSRDISGFKATSKLQQIVQWVQSIPQEEKAIVYSFFEGSLDLLEGIFVENLEIECARFDDDVDSIVQANELSRFKKSPTCRVLLATVQSSGTGLNIEEANHIAFLDRCFDTAVHRQAEDRCHNLRQKKEVEVTYFDGSMTIDEVNIKMCTSFPSLYSILTMILSTNRL
jgi:SNF2 family DNA or RNA helicase